MIDGYKYEIIIHDNKYAQLVTSNSIIFNKIKHFLSYKVPGVEYTAAYQSGWSGLTYLMDKKGYFLSGLVFKVQKYFDILKIKYVIKDLRAQSAQAKPLDLSNKLNYLNLLPRYYQNDIVNIALKNNKGIIRAATGSGKTLTTALLIAKLNKPTIVYVIGLDLLDQFHKLYSKIFDEKIGYIGNGICDPARITVASIWTIGKALNLDNKKIIDDDFEIIEKDIDKNKYSKILEVLKNSKIHIYDESHVVTTNTISAIHKEIDPEYIYGFSGTPFRDDNSDLLINGILGEQLININASQLIKDGYLAAPIIKFITVPKMHLSNNSSYLSVYKEYIVENEVRNNLIIKHTKELLSKNYTPLILFKQINHGNILLEKFKKADIKCEMLYGNDSLDRRNEIKQMLIDKQIDCILGSTIWDLGLDLPELNALVLCGGGKSSIRALQRIGRVIRPYKNKKFAAVIDLCDQAKYLKQHSIRRYSIYKSEEGFKVIKSKEMKVD